MPIPKPKSQESKKDYLQRCMADSTMQEYDQEQRYAICQNKWSDKDSYVLKSYFKSYDDYPKAASENAKIALRYAEENGWGDCGTPVGKKRANDLAANRPLSRDTIAKMAGFERHRQNSKKELGDGCGRLMWLAWGGDEGIEWASRKLKQIDDGKA